MMIGRDYTYSKPSHKVAVQKLWASILFWVLPSAFVWLALLNIDGTLYIPNRVGIIPPLLLYPPIVLYRMKFAVFTRRCGIYQSIQEIGDRQIEAPQRI